MCVPGEDRIGELGLYQDRRRALDGLARLDIVPEAGLGGGTFIFFHLLVFEVTS